MFTGLVEKISKVISVNLSDKGARFKLENEFSDLNLGESISVNGVCQTVIEFSEKTFEFEAMPNTLNVTNLKNLKTSDIVNLERAMKANGRFDGHIVSGHIDCTSKLISKVQSGISEILRFKCDTKYIINKGSICINGVSLTVSKVEDNFFEVGIIPHTLKNTNLYLLKKDDIVNIEYDIIAKYSEKFCTGNKNTKIDENFLKECGF